MYRILLSSITLILLSAGCVQQPTSQSKVGDPAKTESTTSIDNPFFTGTPTSTARQDIYYSWKPTISENGRGVTFSATNLPSWMKINPATGELYGLPIASGRHNHIYFHAYKLDKYTSYGPFTITVVGDPFKYIQWHLANYGQASYVESGRVGKSGEDVHQKQTIQDGLTGNGITVFLSDTGLDINHPDLAPNIRTNITKNYRLSSPYYGDPGVNKIPSQYEPDNGTSNAGIIGARGWNDIGVRGVAPEVFLAGSNYLSALVTVTSDIKIDQASGDYDIFNFSYYTDHYPYQYLDDNDEDYKDQIEWGFINGRNGKGSIYVKSVGDFFDVCDTDTYAAGKLYYMGGLCAPHHASNDPTNTWPGHIVVGSLSAIGSHGLGSQGGSSLWITAPGGAGGVIWPALVTTDVNGCRAGESHQTFPTVTTFNSGNLEANSNCAYINSYGGTEAATSVISGAIALILHANPNLTARDIKHILASTARKVDSTSININHPTGLNLTGLTYDYGWVTNAAGYSFHNWYGFGGVNIDSAVAMAKTYSVDLGTFTEKSYYTAVNTEIPDYSATGVESSITFTDDLIVEAIKVEVNIEHKHPGELGLELTSPSGTKSVIWNINSDWLIPVKLGINSPGIISDMSAMPLSSNAFYGETANAGDGKWKLKVVDAWKETKVGSDTYFMTPAGKFVLGGLGGSTQEFTGTMIDWTLTGYGHVP